MIHSPLSQRPRLSFRRTLSEQVETSLLLFFIVCGGIILTLSLTFLFLSNKNATRGYELRFLQEQRASLIQSNEILAMQITEHEALSTLNQKTEQNNLVTAPIAKVIKVETAIASVPKY